MEYVVEKEPLPDTINQICQIAQDYVRDYFTENVPSDTKKDLLFQQAVYLKQDHKIIAFIVFTCWDGAITISLMATRREYAGKGYGKHLMHQFAGDVKKLGFDHIVLYTVPPEKKPVYAPTVTFYKSLGFMIEREYSELWEQGALKMVKTLQQN